MSDEMCDLTLTHMPRQATCPALQAAKARARGHVTRERGHSIPPTRAHVLKRRIITDNLHLGMWPRFYSQSDSVIYALIQSEISPHTCDSSRR